jgi:hypothetical protein
MPSLSRERVAWIRHLAWHGLPPAEVAEVLGVDPSDVGDRLARRPMAARPRPPRLFGGRGRMQGSTGSKVRRLHALGYPPSRIAELLILDAEAVSRMLFPARDPTRRIKGPLVNSVRRLHAAGATAAAIAEALTLDLVAVAAFLNPPAPTPKPPRERRPPPGPRWGWSGWVEPPDPPVEPAICPAPPDQVVPELGIETNGTDADDAGRPSSADDRPAEGWGPYQETWPSGGRNGNAALSDAEAAEVRALRAAGKSVRELAERFNVHISTIKRICARRTYPDPPPAVEVLGPPPAAAETPSAPGHRWSPADDRED